MSEQTFDVIDVTDDNRAEVVASLTEADEVECRRLYRPPADAPRSRLHLTPDGVLLVMLAGRVLSDEDGRPGSIAGRLQRVYKRRLVSNGVHA